MNYFDVLGMAFGAIFRNKVRSALTALGIVIGVGSVIAMVHLGQAATASVTAQISSMGSNLLIVRSSYGRRGPGGTRSSSDPFTNTELELIRREISGVRVAPTVRSSQTLVWSGANYPADVLGTDDQYFDIRNWEVDRGRLFETSEIEKGSTVCVVGATVVTELFGTSDPLGETVRVGRTACQVIGVMKSKGTSFGEDIDGYLVMPTLAVQMRLLGNTDLREIYVSADDAHNLPTITADLTSMLRQHRGVADGKENDFDIRDMQEIADTLQGTTQTLTMLLGAIAAVSLLVGGIGIMNIMLVSVSERTREIGIRIAIGATVRDVLTQFLIEAVTLSMLGGLFGVALGIAGTYFATDQMNLPFILTPEVMLIGFGFSAMIGIVFGYVPARKAAHLNPIEALRHE